MLLPLGQRHGLLQTVLQQVAVGKFGQEIEVGLALKLFLIIPGFGDVVQHSDEMRDLPPVIAYRGDMHVVPEKTAVLAVATKRGMGLALLRERRLDIREPRLIGVGSEQEIGISAERLRRSEEHTSELQSQSNLPPRLPFRK